MFKVTVASLSYELVKHVFWFLVVTTHLKHESRYVL